MLGIKGSSSPHVIHQTDVQIHQSMEDATVDGIHATSEILEVTVNWSTSDQDLGSVQSAVMSAERATCASVMRLRMRIALSDARGRTQTKLANNCKVNFHMPEYLL